MTNAELIVEYEKVVAECDAALHDPLPEGLRKLIKFKLNRAKDWLAFLNMPDTPELNW